MSNTYDCKTFKCICPEYLHYNITKITIFMFGNFKNFNKDFLLINSLICIFLVLLQTNFNN